MLFRESHAFFNFEHCSINQVMWTDYGKDMAEFRKQAD